MDKVKRWFHFRLRLGNFQIFVHNRLLPPGPRPAGWDQPPGVITRGSDAGEDARIAITAEAEPSVAGTQT